MVSNNRRSLRVLEQTWNEHRVLLLMSLAFIAVGGFIQTRVLHRPWPIQLASGWFTAIWLWGSTIWLGVHVIGRSQRRRGPLSAEQFVGAIVVASLAVPFQITFQSLKQSLGRERGFPWDSDLAALDSAIHGGPAWHWYAFLLDRPVVLKSVDILYVAWFLAFAGVFVWLCWSQMRPLRQRALIAVLMLWIVGGTLGAWTFASSGPCYRAATDPDAAALLARLDASGSALIAAANQRRVWAGFQSDQWLPFGGISAMPSLHVGLSVLMAIIVWQRSRPIGLAFWMCAGIMQIGSVILGWHYGIDGYAGAGAAYVAWVVAGATQAQWGGISPTGARYRNACERDATRDGPPPQPFGQLRTTSRRWE